jgi:hypothetical protein
VVLVLRIICAVVFMALASPSNAAENDIDGFQLGMTTEQVLNLAAEKGYAVNSLALGKHGNSPNATVYALSGGPVISFCGNVVTSISTSSRSSNLHEFANVVNQWTQALGRPSDRATVQHQDNVQGLQSSSLSYSWYGTDNVGRAISFGQQGTDSPFISYSYGYIKHPCQ